jgi:hypothetical protein
MMIGSGMTKEVADRLNEDAKKMHEAGCSQAEIAGFVEEEVKKFQKQARYDQLKERISNDFTYHSPKMDQANRYGDIRAKGREFAMLLLETVPFETREFSMALTKLEEAVFWANAAIARNE